MSTLSRFKQLEKEEKKAMKESNRLAKINSTRRESQEKELWDAFLKSAKELDQQTVRGHKRLEFLSNPNKRLVSLYVNNELYLQFFPKWKYYSCNCENTCNCTIPDPTVSLETVEKRRDGTDYYLYFPCYSLEDLKSDKLADALFEALNSFKYRDLH